MSKSMFITLEGIEGVGKSTHMDFIRELLEGQGRKVTVTREPGGTKAGEAIRDILLNSGQGEISDLAELTLMFAARAQHLEEVIRPSLANGDIVLCDRFTDATYAYQGGGRGMPEAKIRALEELVQDRLRPDLTCLFDAPVEVGLSRAKNRGGTDRFEKETRDFFEKVRRAYLAIAAREPERMQVINAAETLDEVRENLRKVFGEKGLC